MEAIRAFKDLMNNLRPGTKILFLIMVGVVVYELFHWFRTW